MATIEAIEQLNAELLDVQLSLESTFGLRLGQRVQSMPQRVDWSLDQLTYIQYAYMSAMLSIHTVLAYPWIRALIGVRSSRPFHDEVARSVATVVNISREAILFTDTIHFNAHTTVPSVFRC